MFQHGMEGFKFFVGRHRMDLNVKVGSFHPALEQGQIKVEFILEVAHDLFHHLLPGRGREAGHCGHQFFLG